MHIKNNNGSILPVALLILSIFAGVTAYAYSRISSGPETTPKPEPTEAAPQTVRSFSFAAAGDFDDETEARQVIQTMADKKTDFILALGDLGYTKNKESEWCAMVTERVGENYPFELLAGNHDDGSDGDIQKYAACLPNRMEGMVGEYGIEYYFDIQNHARFIQISPDIDNYGFDYGESTEHRKCLTDAIDLARQNDIPWVIVSMHKDCITPGEKECEIGSDLFNLLVERRVDLILQGHEHAYFRSKQLALSDECPLLQINQFNRSCISNEGVTLKKGEGSVVVISGAGGKELRAENLNDPERDYFAAFNSKDAGDSYGFSMFTVTENSLQASFVPVIGSFTDTFSISSKLDL